MSRFLKRKKEETKPEPKSTEPTKPVYHVTRGGISLVGENVYEKTIKEIREKDKDKKDKTGNETLIDDTKDKLGLPTDIDFVDTRPENPFFYVKALSPEDAKKKIGEYQSKLETGHGIKINLKKLEARKL